MTPRLRVLAPLVLTSLALLLCFLPAQAQTRLTLISYSYASDQRVCSPASTVRIYALLTEGNALSGTWSFQSATFTVDGTPHTATVSSSNICYFDWDTTGAANPSEHAISVTATVHCSYPASTQTLSSDTTGPPPAQGPYSGIYGDGRVADFIVADIRLKSIGFSGNITLTTNVTTPLSTPEFTWNPADNSLLTYNPAAYVQGKSVGFTMTLCDSTGAALTGSATTGYALKLQADPNAINAATGQPIPPLTLYDNTTASPIAPTPFSGSTITVTASTALGNYVARYTTTFSPVNFYVKFTHVTPTPTWGLAGSCTSSGNTLYAILNTPTAPMMTPWVPVLNYACQWATGATDATSATTALAKGLYDTGTYNEYTSHTIWPTPHQDGVETFSVLGFLSNLQGDCRDFSDLMVCLSNAVGAKPLQSQRSAPVKDIDSQAASLNTKNFVPAPWGPSVPSPQSWVYHQWSTSDNVFDACVGTSATPLVNLPLQTYFSTLVDQSLPYEWKPQTAFQPTLSN